MATSPDDLARIRARLVEQRDAAEAALADLDAVVRRQAEAGPADLLSPAEVARRLGVSRNSVYDLIKRGDLPARKLGRRVVVPLVAVEALQRTHPSPISATTAARGGRPTPLPARSRAPRRLP